MRSGFINCAFVLINLPIVWQDDPYIRATCRMQNNKDLTGDVKAANNISGEVSFRQLVNAEFERMTWTNWFVTFL